MSMLRFVLRKINVIHNSLIKFWSVRNSNEGASLFQSIAQAKVKLRLDEAGRISNCSIWLIMFFVSLAIVMPLFWLLPSNLSFWPSLGSSSGISLIVSIPITISFVNYLNKPKPFASVKFRSNGLKGKVEFFDSNTSQANSSKISQGIINLGKTRRRRLRCGNSETKIVEKICKDATTHLQNVTCSVKQSNQDIEVCLNSEIYSCYVVWN